MNAAKTLISLSLATLLTACAHHNNVRPSDSGEHYVKLTAQTKSEAGNEALKQSKHFCGEQDKKAYVLNENITYVGSMPEEEYLQNLNIASAVETAGTVLWVLGENAVDDVGAAMSIGGGIAEDSMGQPYELVMSFTCR
jgi:hypothetical protein